ncbi:MAG: AAA family ATPase [Thioploca sp.]|nr:AAA family ATPase [Thioploca sp.]
MPAISNKSQSLSNLVRSSNTLYKLPIILIYGPRRSGKTVYASTISKFMPVNFNERTNNDPPITLEDILWITYDEGALDSLRQFNIIVPYVVDPYQIMQENSMTESAAISFIYENLNEILLANPNIKFVVHDTISQMDKLLTAYIASIVENSNDSQTIYRLLLGRHQLIFNQLQKLKATSVLLCHAKALIERATKDAKVNIDNKNIKASKFHIPAEIGPDITGKGAELYLSNSSAEIVVLNKRGAKNLIQRTVHFNQVDGFEAGSRFEGFNLDNEKFHLRSTLQKIGLVNQDQ